MKRRLQRVTLRVASEHEAAFRATIGALEAFSKLGLPFRDLSVELVPLGKLVSMAIVVKQDGRKPVIHRIDDHPLPAPLEKRRSDWVDWVGNLCGDGADIPTSTREAMYRASPLSKPAVANALREMLKKNGVEVP